MNNTLLVYQIAFVLFVSRAHRNPHKIRRKQILLDLLLLSRLDEITTSIRAFQGLDYEHRQSTSIFL